MVTCLTLALLPLVACDSGQPLSLDAGAAVVSADTVRDLTILEATDSAITLRWTQVEDGAGAPAGYRVRYAPSASNWTPAGTACEGPGDEVGADMACTIGTLAPTTSYDFQLISFRLSGASVTGAVYSNVVSGATTPPGDEPTDSDQPGDTAGGAGPPAPDLTVTVVRDLAVAEFTSAGLTVSWTQVNDGTGAPARYRVKYADPPIDWKSATTGCNTTGDAIGARISCTIEGLDSGGTYDVQLMSYHVVDGAWQDAAYSNIATTGTDDSTEPTQPLTPPSASGVWISPAEVRRLPMSGTAWQNLLSAANRSCGAVDLADQEQSTNVCVMAKALVFARTGDVRYRTDVVTALAQIVAAPRYGGRALALGRELGTYVIAADLVDLENHDPVLDGLFRSALRTLRTAYTTGAASSLIDCHERRPNNWGAHCGGTRAAIAVYLGDTKEIERTAQVFRGYLGDRSAYAGFSHGGPADDIDLSWQCDPDRPVGINPAGCTRNGMSLDGVLPDDQRRGGSFTTSPPKENYVWEALQGLLAQAVILHRAGYPVWEWEDRALLRAVRWLHEVNDFPAEGDDAWQTHIINYYYGTSFPSVTGVTPGKNVGWTDWTHG